VFNSAEFLPEVVLSVLAQSFSDWELILVDDCSLDSSVEIIESFASLDARIKLIRLAENCGVATARNRATEVAQGRYIGFLDSDDLWLSDKLEKQINFMKETNCALSYTAYEKIDEHGKAFQIVDVPQRVCYQDLLKTCVIGCLTAVYDTDQLGKIYMPVNSGREDFATWLAILKRIDFASGLPEVLAQYRVYSAQSSSKKTKMAVQTWHLYRTIEGFSLVKSAYYFVHYSLRGVLRMKFPRLAKRLGVL